MLYVMLFLVRYFPFWAIPVALVAFELGIYHFNRRERTMYNICFITSLVLTGLSIAWIVFEGYWTAAPFVKRTVDLFHF
jgi:hypothetical protein